jgi:hypothetical protein
VLAANPLHHRHKAGGVALPPAETFAKTPPKAELRAGLFRSPKGAALVRGGSCAESARRIAHAAERAAGSRQGTVSPQSPMSSRQSPGPVATHVLSCVCLEVRLSSSRSLNSCGSRGRRAAHRYPGAPGTESAADLTVLLV